MNEIRDFPIECIGIMLEFCDSPEVFFRILLLSKAVKRYIENEYQECARNMKFILNQHLSFEHYMDPFPFMRKLIISENPFFSNGFQLSRYPNLEDLSLFNQENIDDEIFKHLPNLKKLKVIDCSKLMKSFSGFHSCTNIVVLKLYWLCSIGVPRRSVTICINSRIFRSLNKLEELIIRNIEFTPFRTDDFLHLTRLRRLKLFRVTGIHSNIFRHVGDSLQCLELYNMNCSGMTQVGLEFLKKLKTLIIEFCEYFGDRESVLRSCSSSKPEMFVFKSPVMENNNIFGDDEEKTDDVNFGNGNGDFDDEINRLFPFNKDNK